MWKKPIGSLLKRFFPDVVLSSLGSRENAVTLQKPMKAGTGQSRDLRLQSEHYVVERQQRPLAEGDDRSLLQWCQHR
jgi:hypothetical protein